jgi:uncharacterized protein YkwD
MQLIYDFEDGDEGWRYLDDLFRFEDAPEAARGWHAEGAADGALAIGLGGTGADADGTSGGWREGFSLDDEQAVTLTLRYKIKQNPNYERGEWGELRVALDGKNVGLDGNPYIDRIGGDGNGGGARSTGWQEVTIELGPLEAGRHRLDIGGLIKADPARSEVTKIYIDEVRIESAQGEFEARVLELTNEFREENGLDPLRFDPKLGEAAGSWSREMAEGDFFEHSDTRELAEEHGYEWRALGENIAAGQTTPEEVVEGWIGSPGHRANLLSEDFDELGVGYHFEENDGGRAPYGHYWTQVFGTEL